MRHTWIDFVATLKADKRFRALCQLAGIDPDLLAKRRNRRRRKGQLPRRKGV